MKSISQIAKETGVEKHTLHHLVHSNNLSRAIHEPKDGKRYKVMYVCSETESKLHHILHITGKLEYLILESKMNKKWKS